MYATCLEGSQNDIKMLTKMLSKISLVGVKIVFCNRCNVFLKQNAEIKSMITDMKASFEQRYAELEIKLLSQDKVIKSENVITESVARSLRVSNIIIYHVPPDPNNDDCAMVNDFLEVVDPCLVAPPD